MMRIVVGQVEIRYDGAVSLTQLRNLLREATGLALMIGGEAEAEEPKPAVALGFTTEIAPLIEPDLSEFFEEE